MFSIYCGSVYLKNLSGFQGVCIEIWVFQKEDAPLTMYRIDELLHTINDMYAQCANAILLIIFMSELESRCSSVKREVAYEYI